MRFTTFLYFCFVLVSNAPASLAEAAPGKTLASFDLLTAQGVVAVHGQWRFSIDVPDADGRTVYLTARDRLYRIALLVEGVRP